ncbi:GspH/FimT family pseudopilin [Halomonas aquatica]|uniref:Type II secretion system protein H n=1 Tax=Halomonas aquatica TaxID=3151123 RepID=A0ABV1NLC6_9GAMM
MMKNRGFTLIELLVTIAVIVIMVTIAIPNFSSFVASGRLAAEYNNVLTGLHYARSEAVKRRKVVAAEITTSASGQWEMDVKVGSDILRSFSATSGSISVNDGNDGVVKFSGLGRRVLASGGECTFPECKVTVGNKNIEINAVGNILGSQP